MSSINNMSKIYNRSTDRYISVSNAIKKGLLEEPDNFIIPRDKILVKTKKGFSLKKQSNLQKFIKKKEDLLPVNTNYIFNPLTGRVIKNNQKNKNEIFKNQFRFISKDGFEIKDINSTKRLRKVIREVKKIDQKFKLKINDKTFVLNHSTMDNLLKPIDISKREGSDKEIMQLVNIYNKIKFTPVSSSIKNQPAFFKHTHLLNGLDLKPLGIFHNDEINDEKNIDYFKDNCFIHMCKDQIDDVLIENFKYIIRTREIPSRILTELGKKYNICFEGKYLNSKEGKASTNFRKAYFGNKESKTIVKFCVLDDHYFKDIDIPVTSYALKHYEEIKDDENWTKFNYKTKTGKHACKKSRLSYMNSFLLVYKLLEEKKYLKKINTFEIEHHNPYNDKIEKTFPILENHQIMNHVKLNQFKEKTEIEMIDIFFDFETYNEIDNKITPYQVRYYVDKSSKYFKYYKKKIFNGKDCAKNFLDDICRTFLKHNSKIRLLAHNLKFDLTFLFPHLYRPNFVDTGSSIMSGEAVYYYFNQKINLYFQDTCSIISAQLAKFGEMFQLQQEKEFIPYKLSNPETLKNIDTDDKIYMSMKEIKPYIKLQLESMNIGKNIDDDMVKEYTKILKKNAKKFNCIDSRGYIDIVKYSGEYCYTDCVVLANGYNKFVNLCSDKLNINAKTCISAAQIANTYMNKNGVFDGVYQISGVLQQFIQKAMVGGRTMTRKNKAYHVKKELDDFDAVSLYPSAMNELKGYLKGVPKKLSSLDYETISKYDGYFVEIEILKVGKRFSFPLMSKINKKTNVRTFTNNMKGERIYVDKTSLEDLINFQKIEFKIIRGYYFNEGRNEKLCEVVKNLFEERKKQKKAKNPLQEILKLILNSAYGKTLQRPFDDKIEYIRDKDIDDFIKNNYNFIKESTQVSEKYHRVVKIEPIADKFNNCHCGVEVLSMSKRIMNRVMCLAEDLKMKIYYQDTDSMHIEKKSVDELSSKFKKKYGTPLIGKDLGQFHGDFDSQILTGDIFSKESIFLGKKCYIDMLVDDKSDDIDYHIRMKGVSCNSIKHYSKNNNQTVFETFLELSKGKELKFDLTCGGLKFTVEKKNIALQYNNVNFEREISFPIKNKLITVE